MPPRTLACAACLKETRMSAYAVIIRDRTVDAGELACTRRLPLRVPATI
jgi:hypothetical protein